MSLEPYEGWHDNDAWHHAETRRKRETFRQLKVRFEKPRCEHPDCHHTAKTAFREVDGTIRDVCMYHYLMLSEAERCEEA